MAPKFIKYQGQWFQKTDRATAATPKMKDLGVCENCRKAPAVAKSWETELKLCENCLTEELHDFNERLQKAQGAEKRELGTCQACGKKPATELYSISEDETYELCAECLEEQESAATGAEEKMHEICIVCEKPCVPGEDPYDLDELQRHVHDECYNSYNSTDEYYAETMDKE